MSKYGEIVGLLEWATNQRNKNDKPRRGGRSKGRKTKYGFEEYMKFKKELEEFEKWEKTMLKKDIKQDEKKHGPALSALHIAMILIASFPIIAPLYTWWIRSILSW